MSKSPIVTRKLKPVSPKRTLKLNLKTIVYKFCRKGRMSSGLDRQTNFKRMLFKLFISLC